MLPVARVPDVTIATDVICGFPTETAKVGICSPLAMFCHDFLYAF